MQNISRTLFAASAAAMLLAGTAMAQSTMSPNPTPAPSTSGATASSSSGGASTIAAPPASTDLTADADVIGLVVKSSDNAKVGKIDNVLVSADGKVDKVVIDVGGVLGLGGKDVVVNWGDLQINSGQREAQIAMSQDQLKNAPPFRPSRHADASMDNGTAK